ncbi:hypothetical protein AVEN_192060-1 [Araneus ventricosus]|uniref:Uncharacterized protein n=1 Tax=Araneus ventricosus TaxID=182803 RepID=A0A4Y2B982_ARAVE|nr:hypothetical protein AVEN_192060-1 [Araneus ventricosus]
MLMTPELTPRSPDFHGTLTSERLTHKADLLCTESGKSLVERSQEHVILRSRSHDSTTRSPRVQFFIRNNNETYIYVFCTILYRFISTLVTFWPLRRRIVGSRPICEYPQCIRS